MQHWHIHEAVDHTFRDVRGSDKPFGGLSVVFGGDFQQILPIHACSGPLFGTP